MAKRTRYNVLPGETGWKVKRTGAGRASSVHPTKAQAVERGRKLAQAQALGQLVIYKLNGTIQEERTYGEDPYPPKG